MKKRKKIRVSYSSFYKSFNADSFYITNILRSSYDVELVEEGADLLIYGVFNDDWKGISARKKLFFTGENVFPDFNECDYAMSCVRMDVPDRYFYASSAFNYLPEVIGNYTNLDVSLAKRKFCCFIYSNASHGIGAVMRRNFCEFLMKYHSVDCPGRVLHNMEAPELSARYCGEWHDSKGKFISQYKFIIAFENTDGNGYVTEKLVDAYVNNVVPIYWGSTMDISPFPKESMIYAPDYPTFEALVQRIKEVDENDDLYMQILNANPLRNKSFCDSVYAYRENFRRFITMVAESLFDYRAPFESRNTYKIETTPVYDFVIPHQNQRINTDLADANDSVCSLMYAQPDGMGAVLSKVLYEISESRAHIVEVKRELQSAFIKNAEQKEEINFLIQECEILRNELMPRIKQVNDIYEQYNLIDRIVSKLCNFRLEVRHESKEQNSFVVEGADSLQESCPVWLCRDGYGKLLEGAVGSYKLRFSVRKEGKMSFVLRGCDYRGNKGRIPVWLDVSYVKIDGQQYCSRQIWHDKPFSVTLSVQTGQQLELSMSIAPCIPDDAVVGELVESFYPDSHGVSIHRKHIYTAIQQQMAMMCGITPSFLQEQVASTRDLLTKQLEYLKSDDKQQRSDVRVARRLLDVHRQEMLSSIKLNQQQSEEQAQVICTLAQQLQKQEQQMHNMMNSLSNRIDSVDLEAKIKTLKAKRRLSLGSRRRKLSEEILRLESHLRKLQCL